MIGQTIRIGTKGAYIISAVASATSITLKNPDASAPSPSAGSSLTYNVGPESPYDIASVDSNTQITLAKPWSGPTLTGIAYECWRPISIIGDVSGALTDGVGGAVRITGSDNDTTATRSSCVTASSKNYITLQGLTLDTPTASGITPTDCINWIIQDCVATLAVSFGITVAGASQAKMTIRRCLFSHFRSHAIQFTHSSTVSDAGHLIENCIFQGAPGSDSVQLVRVGGTLMRNCTSLDSLVSVAIQTALAVGQAITVNNCLLLASSTALSATTVSEIIEDFNDVFLPSTARTNTTAGANGVSSSTLLDTPILLAGYRFPYQFAALSNYSSFGAKAGMNPPADDFYGMLRPATNSKCSWGAIQYQPFSLDTTTFHAGTGSYKLADAGRIVMQIPTGAVSTVFSVYCYREANYAGTLPQMIVRQAGQADTIVTDTGSASTWNQLTTTLTPAAAPVWVEVLFISNNTASSSSFAAYFDTFSVS